MSALNWPSPVEMKAYPSLSLSLSSLSLSLSLSSSLSLLISILPRDIADLRETTIQHVLTSTEGQPPTLPPAQCLAIKSPASSAQFRESTSAGGISFPLAGTILISNGDGTRRGSPTSPAGLQLQRTRRGPALQPVMAFDLRGF